jgi:SAM-dependent methyltransferase
MVKSFFQLRSCNPPDGTDASKTTKFGSHGGEFVKLQKTYDKIGGERNMMKLYSELAPVYDEMYRSIFDYEMEARFYDGLLAKYGRRSVLEIGCGGGHLSSPLQEAGYRYAGLDLSADMLRIARRHHPGTRFIRGDMRKFALGRTFDAVIITGRTFSHLVRNEDVMGTLKSVHAALRKNGLLAFDCFRADRVVWDRGQESVQDVKRGDTLFRRLNRTSPNLETGWTFNWEAEYHIRKEGRKEKVVKDKTVLRAFTADELGLFLKLGGFDVLECGGEKFYRVSALSRAARPVRGRRGGGDRYRQR